MSKWNTLTQFQRVLLIALAVLLAVFTAVYPILGRREGIPYRDALLLWSAQGETDVYAGRVDGERTVFTVAPDGTIQYRRGDTDYGPYAVTLDPSAVPRDSDMADVLTGVEVRDGEKILFRGGWYNSGFPLLVDEHGETESPFTISVHTSGGKVYGPDGQALAPSYEPTAPSSSSWRWNPLSPTGASSTPILPAPCWPLWASSPSCSPTSSSAGTSASASGTRSGPSPRSGRSSPVIWAGSSVRRGP